MHPLKALPLFASIPDLEFEAWLTETAFRKKVFHNEDVLAWQGDSCKSVYILLEGKAYMEMGEEGRDIVVEHITGPAILASAFLFGTKSEFPVTIKAASEGVLYLVNKERFLLLMQKHHDVLLAFLQDISNRCEFLSQKVRSFALKNLRVRVLDYLSQKGAIESVQEVALQLGVQRPSLSRILGELLVEGLIKKHHEGFMLHKKTIQP